MSKIAIIGAGSLIFCKTLLNDILATQSLEGFKIALMGPTLSKIEKMEGYAQKISMIDIPEGTVGVPIPMDPARAINSRFGKLAQ